MTDVGAHRLRAPAKVVPPSDLERLVLTRRYWALQALVESNVEPVGELVLAEFHERVDDLAAACAELENQIHRWGRPGELVMPDTSFYLRHRDRLEDVDFAELL